MAIDPIQFQGYTERQGFEPIKLPDPNPFLRENLSSINNSLQNLEQGVLRNMKAEYTGKAANQTRQLEALQKFSQSLTGVMTTAAQQFDEYRQTEMLGLFYEDEEARRLATDQQTAGEVALNQAHNATSQAAVNATKSGAPYSVAERLQNLSGLQRYYYAQAAAKDAAENYQTERDERLVSDSSTITIIDEFGNKRDIAINKPDKTRSEHAAVVAHLRQEYLSKLNGVSRGMLAKHVFPTMEKADDAAMRAHSLNADIQESITTRNTAFENLLQTYETDDTAVATYLNTVYNTRDSKGNVLGYGGARAELFKSIKLLEQRGIDVDLEQIKKSPIPGGKPGETMGSRFKMQFMQLEEELEDQARGEYKEDEEARIIQANQLEEDLMTQVRPDMTEAEYLALQDGYKRGRHQLGLDVQESSELKNYYENLTLSAQEKQDRIQLLKFKESKGLLTMEDLANQPPEIQQQFLKSAQTQDKLRAETGQYKTIDKEIEGTVLNNPSLNLLPGQKAGGNANLVIEHLKAEHRKRTLALMASPEFENDPNRASLQAWQDLQTEYNAGQTNPNSIYYVDQNGFSNFIDPSGEDAKARVRALEYQTKVITTTKDNPKWLENKETVTALVGGEDFFKKIENGWGAGPGRYEIHPRIAYIADLLNVSPFAVIHQARQTLGMTELPKLAEYAATYANAPLETRQFINKALQGLSTSNQYRRQTSSQWDVRPVFAGTIPNTSQGYEPVLSLIRSGEGGWNSVNRGRAGDTPGGLPKATSMTIGQLDKMQAQKQIFAVGAYQFTPGVLIFAMKQAGLKGTDLFTPENQNRMALALMFGSKRPRLAAYLRGESNDLNGAHRELSLEWAGVIGPDGRGAYDGDAAGNRGTISAQNIRQALIQARKYYMSGGNRNV